VRKAHPNATDAWSKCVLRTRDASGTTVGWLTYRVEMNGVGTEKNIFSIEPNEIKENGRLLEEIWNHATEYRGTPAPRARRSRPRP